MRRSCHAFTLIEILTAMSIFSVAFVGIIEGITIQIRAEKLAENTTRAVILAQNLIEEIRYAEDFELASETGEFTGPDTGFIWMYDLVEGDMLGLYTLTVTVDWDNGTRSYTAETMIAEREATVEEVETMRMDNQQGQMF